MKVSPPRLLASRNLWRRSKSGFTMAHCDPVVARDHLPYRYMILFLKKSCPTDSQRSSQYRASRAHWSDRFRPTPPVLQVKMAVRSHDDHLMCRVFPSCFKVMALDWFYPLSSQSLQIFEEVSDAFFNQYASRQEFKKNTNHVLIINMKPGEALKLTSVIFRTRWLWFITVAMMLLRSRSLSGCRLITPTNIW